MLLLRTVDLFFSVYIMLLFARVILSWIRPGGYNPLYIQITSMVHAVTEPILGPIRSLLPTVGMIDFSPIIALIILRVLRGAVLEFIRNFIL